MEKAEVRKDVARRVASLTPSQRAEKDSQIAHRFLSLPEFRSAQDILVYASMDDEIDTAPIAAAALARGKRIYYPITIRGTRSIEVAQVEDIESDLAPGSFGIREPKKRKRASPEALDLLLIPGRAFDLEGNRLGRGAAYYDIFLGSSELSAPRCALAYDCQVMERIPHTKTDQRIDILVTESRLLRFARGKPGSQNNIG